MSPRPPTEWVGPNSGSMGWNLSPKEQARVLREGKAERHRADVHHKEGWVSFRIGDKEGIERAKELVQLAYDNAKGTNERSQA